MSLGVWTPQGALSGFSATAGNPNVRYDPNPVILSANGDGKIWKMWYAHGANGGGLSYAESADGATWTQYGSNPILAAPGSGYGFPKVFKNGSTYYIYMTAASFANIRAYTSTDGVTLSAPTTAMSATQTWESNDVMQLMPVDIISGTWYGLYGGSLSTFYMGMATSTDGLTWTKYGGNPTIFAGTANPWNIKVGSTYYMWTQRLNAYGTAGISRYSAANAWGPWTEMPVFTYTASTTAEGVTLQYSFADPTLLEVNGTCSMYGTITNGGASAGIAYATAALTMAQLVQTAEGIVNVPAKRVVASPVSATSQYNTIGSDTTLTSGNYTAFNGGTPSYGAGFASGQGGAFWSANSFAALNDQWSTVKAKVANSTTSIIAAGVRMSSSANTAYFAQWTGAALGSAGTLTLDKYVAGVHTVLKSISSVTLSATNTLTLAAVGTQLSVYINGALWWTQSDNAIASGNPGFSLTGASTGTDAEISAFSCGVLNYSVGGNVGAVAQQNVSDGTTTIQTDYSGNFIIMEPPGSVTLTPSSTSPTQPSVYSFSPTNSTLTVGTAASTGVNFAAGANGVVQTITDQFFRADGALGANWTTYTGFSAPTIVGYTPEPSATATNCAALYTGVSFGNDQYSWCQIPLGTASSNLVDSACDVGAFARLLSTGTHGYFWYASGPTGAGAGALHLGGSVALTTYTVGAATNTATITAGDVLLLTCIGTTISGYQNGVLIARATDSHYASGSPGFYVRCDSLANQGAMAFWAAGAVSGSIIGNAGVGGATITYSGAASGSVVADANGNYSISPAVDGSYTLTPSLTGYTFSPTTSSPTVSGASQTSNFTATQTQVATSTFSPVAGTYTSTQSVTLSNTNSGLTGFAQYYTTDGSTPTISSTLYSGAITVSASETIKVLAVATSYANSAIASAAYVIGASYYSVPDCRVVKPNSATGETNQGTIFYDKQTSSNAAIPPTDSRVAGAPVDGRVNKPTNSRTSGTFGPGE